ncbi:MAG: glucosamine-6-phosphate isomerase [Opitutia bacterium AMD-G3]|nr:MAG: glucosamine-6-phosphate isomerase [Opitutae bacterium AMD-G3]
MVRPDHPIPTDVRRTRAEMGRRAAEHVVTILAQTLAAQPRARVVFACAPSQNEFLAELISQSQGLIDWARIDGFHMDEYIGLGAKHPAGFRTYLRRRLLDHVRLGSFAEIHGEAADSAQEATRYAAMLAAAPIDLICLGIGENGHIAFNDPPVADFDDPVRVKVVDLDHACRQQQLNDGCFASLADVPPKALSLTIPVFRQARHLSVVVPGMRKAQAVAAACLGPLTPKCPASILRTHPSVRLFLDEFAALQLKA